MLYRIWLDNIKQMNTSADYLIASDGTVYGVANNPPYLRKQIEAYVMLASDIVYQKGKGIIPDKVFYELDLVECEGAIGIVYIADGAFRIWFDNNDTEWLDDIDRHFCGNYFQHDSVTEEWRKSVPEWIINGCKAKV